MTLPVVKRVAYVLKRYPRYSETFVVNEILELERAGVDLHIFSLRYPEDGHFQDAISRVRAPVTYLTSTGLKVSEFWASQVRLADEIPETWTTLEEHHELEARHLYQAIRLALEIRRLDIGHIHAHFATEATAIARAAAAFSQIRYSFTAHAKDIFHESVDPAELTKKIRDASAVVTVSEFNREFLGKRRPEFTNSIVRIYNGLDLERFPYDDPTSRPPTILAVGRLVEKKGFNDLVDACHLLNEAGSKFRCEIVGKGELEDALRKQIADLGLESRVHLVGARPQADVIERIRAAALLAAPCVTGADGNRDGLPTVLLEAMALGTPCVSTDVTGIPEAIRHDETGLAVRSNDVRALAAAMQQLLDDESLRVRLARRARQHIETNFDVRRNSRDLQRVLTHSLPAVATQSGRSV